METNTRQWRVNTVSGEFRLSMCRPAGELNIYALVSFLIFQIAQ